MSTYQTGSSLLAVGLTYWQAIIVIVIGNAMGTGFAVLNSVSGAQTHLGFPIVSRSVWGKSHKPQANLKHAMTDIDNRDDWRVFSYTQSHPNLNRLVWRTGRHRRPHGLRLPAIDLDGSGHPHPEHPA